MTRPLSWRVHGPAAAVALYNWPVYAACAAAVAAGAGAASARRLPAPLRAAARAGTAAASWWLPASLAASRAVYDRSPLHGWRWLSGLLPGGPLARALLGAEAVFWAVRWALQFWCFSPRLWRGDRFRTGVHLFMAVLWTWVVAVFAAALCAAG